MRTQRVSTPIIFQPGHMKVRFDPLGVCLIIGTWNYPVTLALSPLVAAISGGNTAVIKPSSMAPATAEVIAQLIPEYLDTNAFSVVLGGRTETTALLEQKWDHIFFTGSQSVGKTVMTAAAKNLTESCSNWEGRIRPSCTPQPTFESQPDESHRVAGRTRGNFASRRLRVSVQGHQGAVLEQTERRCN